MKKLNIPLIPIITGSAALIALIAVVVILTNAGGGAGLYITEATGTVSITSSEKGSYNGASGDVLSQGDIITVGENSSCKLVYKSKHNSDNNYIVAGENTQLVVKDKLNGKTNGEIYLNRGSLICNLAEKDKALLSVRTANSMVYPDESVSKIAYSTDGFEAFTNIYTFMGNSKIQLYDVQGNAVNDMELLIEKRTGQVATQELGPIFSYLNVEFSLGELSAFDLKQLLTIAALVDNFPYSVEEIKAFYDAAAGDASVDTLPTETEPAVTEVPEVTEPEITETTTSPIVIEPPSQTTRAPVTTTAPPQTTVQQQTTTSQHTATLPSDTDRTVTVIIVVDGDETIQEVPYGGDAEMPSVPDIPGKRFVGWDKSYMNITEDTTITAVFEDDNVVKIYHTVTICIADRTTTVQVEDGKDVPLPAVVNIEGYTFKGWDKDYRNVKADMTISAILEKENSATVKVTFMIYGMPYEQVIEFGGTAVPPFTPTTDMNGNPFIGWDKGLANITADTIINAVFGASTYTVTFVIDGTPYPVTVQAGNDAIPPSVPTFDSMGRRFIGWDGNYYAVSSDMTINAIYQ